MLVTACRFCKTGLGRVLPRQTHALQEVGVAGIGTQRVENWTTLDERQAAALFPVSFFEPAKGKIVFSQKCIVPSNPYRVNVDPFCLLFLKCDEALHGTTVSGLRILTLGCIDACQVFQIV